MGYKELKFDKDSVFLVTGGAGFIGSNLCEAITDMAVRCDAWTIYPQDNRKMWISWQTDPIIPLSKVISGI